MKILQYIGVIDLLHGAGGAKRVFCEMANAFATRGHEVYAVCNDFRAGRPFYPLDDRVRFINLDGSGHRKHKPLFWQISRPLRHVAQDMWERYVDEPLRTKKGAPLVQLIREVQPDVVIPYFADDYFSMVQQPMLNVPVILMHHENVQSFFTHKYFVNTRRKIEEINTCPHIQVLQRSYVAGIQKIYRGSIYVIPNVVPQVDENDLADLTAEKPQRTITMISRLSRRKQQHMLIQAFGQIAKRYPEWKVEIFGHLGSPYATTQQNMIITQGLVGRVELMGETKSPLDALRQSDIFAFPSNHPEGWGLALTEAMAVGLPCVGLKTTSSVNELIVDGVNGFLSDNTAEDFAAKLKILMDDQNLRVKMGRAGYAMMKPYAPEKVWDQWETLIENVVQQHQHRKAA
jgi:glycosyltransferase involved in cell wall biosynthesis